MVEALWTLMVPLTRPILNGHTRVPTCILARTVPRVSAHVRVRSSERSRQIVRLLLIALLSVHLYACAFYRIKVMRGGGRRTREGRGGGREGDEGLSLREIRNPVHNARGEI